MKKLLIILLPVLSLMAFGQEKKTVAVLDPICRDNSVPGSFKLQIRGAMESAVTASEEYEAYDRSAFDQIQKEQAFQRTGAVSDSQIKKMGEMAGVDYVLVSEVSAYEGYITAVIKILNVTTGKYDKSVDDYMELSPGSVKSKCREMALSLFGEVPSVSLNPNYSSNYPMGNLNVENVSPNNLVIDLELNSWPRKANVEWRVVSRTREVASSSFRNLGTTYIENSVKFDITGLTSFNANHVVIQLRFSKTGYESVIEDFDVESLLEVNSISYTAKLAPLK